MHREDTEITEELLRGFFSSAVVDIVKRLSRPPIDTPNRPTYREFIESIVARDADPLIRVGSMIVKLADIQDNGMNPNPPGGLPEPGMIDRYMRAATLILRALRLEQTGDRP